jgi:glycosyltransferase involved in cell wall biosynthesis
MKRIAALVPNLPGTAPGQRVRIETWATHLEQFGWTVDLYPFEDTRLNEVFYRSGYNMAKISRLAICYLRHVRLVRRLPPYDVILIYREAALIGPALLERLARRSGTPMVYDLDDPTFLSYRSPTSGWASLLKFPRKTRSLFRLADHVITINNLIGDYARRDNPAVTVVPNFVDMKRYGDAGTPPEKGFTLVWTGSHTTMPNLQTIAPALRRLQAECHAPLRVVGNGTPDLPGVHTEVRQWSAANEARDIADCHVGLLPVNDQPWNRWKFFLKCVQYMAAGLPVVARRIGSNDEVVDDGVNGFLVETQDEWYDRLKALADDPALRRRMAAAARATAVERFSPETQMSRVAAVFNSVVEGPRPRSGR